MQTAPPSALGGLVTALARVLQAAADRDPHLVGAAGRRYAYKIKKPVRLPFVDYRTLEARRRFCEEEVRLNRRLAPTLYLGRRAASPAPRRPARSTAPGPSLEYAVRMRRFPPGALFSEQLEAGTLRPGRRGRAGRAARRFSHRRRCGHGTASRSGQAPARVALRRSTARGRRPARTSSGLRDWLEAEPRRWRRSGPRRLEAAACANAMATCTWATWCGLDGGVAAFDCIEFDPALRWIDVLDDVAFPVMDFCARGRTTSPSGSSTLAGPHRRPWGLPALRF